LRNAECGFRIRKTSASVFFNPQSQIRVPQSTIPQSEIRNPKSLMPWNPGRYHQFQDERFAPFDDLVALVKVRERLRVVDLGCGTGELTRRLADKLPGSEVVGIDSSPEMLARAEEHARSGLRFEQVSIEKVEGEWDLVFSHAAIQWVDDHRSLVPRLLSLLRPNGQLAVQLPSNHGHLTHTLITEIASEEPFRTALDGWSRTSPVLTIVEYAQLLHTNGGREITVFEKIYPSLLDEPGQLADWTAGTALVPYFDRLPATSHESFMERYRERLRSHYPPGPVFYPFRRTLFYAVR
jgi:trans-aconitate 2-methyltransferase